RVLPLRAPGTRHGAGGSRCRQGRDRLHRDRAVTALQALGWDHPRCIGPMLACSDAWCAQTPGVTVEWSFRSLEDFGDQPLEEVAGRFDLVVIDHPFCGRALETGCLAPLDALVSAAVLDELAEAAIGPS